MKKVSLLLLLFVTILFSCKAEPVKEFKLYIIQHGGGPNNTLFFQVEDGYLKAMFGDSAMGNDKSYYLQITRKRMEPIKLSKESIKQINQLTQNVLDHSILDIMIPAKDFREIIIKLDGKLYRSMYYFKEEKLSKYTDNVDVCYLTYYIMDLCADFVKEVDASQNIQFYDDTTTE